MRVAAVPAAESGASGFTTAVSVAGRTWLAAALSAVADLAPVVGLTGFLAPPDHQGLLAAVADLLAVLDWCAATAVRVPAALTVPDAVGVLACQAMVMALALVVAVLVVAEVDALAVPVLLESAVTLGVTDPKVCGPGDGSVLGLGDPEPPWTDELVPDGAALVEPGGGGELLPGVALTLDDALLGGDVLSVGVAVSVGVALVDVAEPVGEALVGVGLGEGLFVGGGVVCVGVGEGDGLGDAR